MIRTHWWSGPLVATLASFAWIGNAAEQAAEDRIVMLGDYRATADPNTSVVSLKLSHRPVWKDVKVEAHGNYLQVLLPGVTVPYPGKFAEGSGPFVKKIAPFQAQDELAIVRIFLSESASKVSGALHQELVDNRVVVTLDHAAINTVLGNVSGSSKSDATADGSINVVRAPQKNMFTMTRTIAIISLFMFLMIILFVGLKRLQRRQHAEALAGAEGRMREVDSLMISPKLKLSVVQVGGEKLVLSIGSDGCHLIKALDPPAQRPALATRQLAPEVQQKVDAEQAASRLVKKIERVNGGAKREQVARAQKPNPEPKRSINYKIDDTGISQSKDEPKTEETSQAVSDLTAMLRQKLSSLPKV